MNVVNWSQGTSADIPVTGYRLYSDNGLPGNSFLIYDGEGRTQQLTYSHSGLEIGTKYTYTLEVLNFNGPSLKSSPSIRYACEVPQLFRSLTISHVEASLLKLTWKQPADDGGCTIQGYEVWADDGRLGSFSALDQTLGSSTFSYDVIGLTIGLQYRLQVLVKNEIGSTKSNIVQTVLADVPNTPTSAPGFDVLETTTQSIKVTINKVINDGGAPILSY